MTMRYQYFAAPSDDEAVAALDLPHGPLAEGEQTGSGHGGPGTWDVIDGLGVEPSVNLADLEELITGEDYADIIENPRANDTLASREDQAMIITVTDSLQAALAELPTDRLPELAADWSHAEEFAGEVSPGDLAAFLTELTGLARRARLHGQRLYCWVTFTPA